MVSMVKLNFDRQKLEGVCRKYGVVAVYAHGSQIKGYAAPDSDSDVAVVVKDRGKLEHGSWNYKVVNEIEDVLGVKNPDVRVVDPNNSPVFLFEIVSSGVCVYEKAPENRIAFESEVMRKYYDTARIHEIYRQYLYADIKERYAN